MPSSDTTTPRLCRVSGRDAWHIYHPGGSRRRISTGETERAAAERVLAEYIAELAKPQAGEVTSTADILTRYLADRTERAKPGAERLRWAHKPLERYFGAKPPELIGEAESRLYAKRRIAEGVKPGTVRTELQALRAALRWAHKTGLSASQPVLDMPARPPARDRWLTREEAARLIAACSGYHVRLFVQIGLNTAARSGAILALTWDRVDLDARLIDFREPGRVETRKRRVRVPINDPLLPVLEAARAGALTEHVIEWAGGPVASVKHGFRDAAKRAGLAGVTPHTMRHTAVTWMMQSGIDPWQVCGMAGMTMDVLQGNYAHHHPDFLRNAARALAGGVFTGTVAE